MIFGCVEDIKAPILGVNSNKEVKLVAKTRPKWFVSIFELCMVENQVSGLSNA